MRPSCRTVLRVVAPSAGVRTAVSPARRPFMQDVAKACCRKPVTFKAGEVAAPLAIDAGLSRLMPLPREAIGNALGNATEGLL